MILTVVVTKRHPTHGDRDHFVSKHRTAPRGVPVEIPEDITGQYEGEELAMARSKRPTDTRIARLEDKHDALVQVVGELRQTVGEVSGKLDVLPQLVEAVKDASDRVQEREHVRVMTDIQVDGANRMGSVKAKLLRGELWVKVAALAGTALAIFEAGRC